jgi:hypothetical protein
MGSIGLDECVLNPMKVEYLMGNESFPSTQYGPILKLLKSCGVQEFQHNYIMIGLHMLKGLSAFYITMECES